MKSLFQNVFFKMGMIFLLIILLLIPAMMVQDLIHERMNRHEEAKFEVSSKHANAQQVIGPILTIPYKITKKVKNTDGTYESITENHMYNILPDQLNVKGIVLPEKRKRGIFEIVVYGSELNISGNFSNINVAEKGLNVSNFNFDKAYVSIGITDLKGVTEQVKIQLNNQSIDCEPGLLSSDLLSSGLHVMYSLDSVPEKLTFDFDLHLNGSENLMFAPLGKVTEVNLESTWSNPSFNGNFLPDSRKISEKGFTAKWKVLQVNRNFPQSWFGSSYNLKSSLFGVDLLLPVDSYQKSMRVAKYALLFIVLTYLVFFFVEVINRILIHPIQYILVGIALILFYVLMLAFSEQMQFNLAYMLASVMTISLVFLYCRSILKSWALAAMTASILLILYSFIFIIIQMQDYALLFGSLGVFVILAVTMYFSRRIDWFDLMKEDSDNGASEE